MDISLNLFVVREPLWELCLLILLFYDYVFFPAALSRAAANPRQLLKPGSIMPTQQ